MKRLVVEGYLRLLYLDLLMHLWGFEQAYAAVLTSGVESKPVAGSNAAEICRAIDLACVFYFKRVQCLQRSAATALLLRRRGFPAEMVIGAQLLPFQSHAWVEINGSVVNDKPYIVDMFTVLDRC